MVLCYHDMTFCRFWEECSDGKECGRRLTEGVIQDSNRLGLLICQFSEKPRCFKTIKKGKNGKIRNLSK